MPKSNTYIFLSFFLFFACQNANQDTEPKVVEVRQEGGRFQLYRNGNPYYIKGASGYEQLEKVALYGGNSIRTWSIYDAERILDEAQCYGLTVTLGLEVGKQWWGDDFNYLNSSKVDQKIDELKKIIEQFKDHPALLMWGVGNEVHLYGGNRLLVLRTINKIAKMIHEVDPNHPVMTTVPIGPNFDKYAYMHIFIPDVDILGINAFTRLPTLIDKIRSPTSWKKAYILSEWGPPGPWESITTEWGAPREKSSNEKADIMKNYWDLIKNDSYFSLGGYAFYWGHKYEKTHTWFSLFSREGYETETVNVMQNIWSKNPENWSPRIDSLIIKSTVRPDNVYLIADSIYNAKIFAHDPDYDTLTFHWELRPEGATLHSTGNFDYIMMHLLLQDNCPSIQFRTPTEEGGYRLFGFVYDGQEHVATHNIPFYVVEK